MNMTSVAHLRTRYTLCKPILRRCIEISRAWVVFERASNNSLITHHLGACPSAHRVTFRRVRRRERRSFRRQRRPRALVIHDRYLSLDCVSFSCNTYNPWPRTTLVFGLQTQTIKSISHEIGPHSLVRLRHVFLHLG